jgi:hypothetical protein
MAELNAKDWSFLDENFQRFGQWRSGLAGIRDQFDVVGQSRWGKYLLDLTLKAPPKVTWRLEIKKRRGGIRTLPATLPEGPTLSDSEQKNVQAILEDLGSLWLVEPLNGAVEIRQVSKGIASFKEGHHKGAFAHRRLEKWAVFYLEPVNAWEAWRFVWFDLEMGAFSGLADFAAARHSPDQIRILAPEEIRFIDEAMKKHGDFGVYGNVQAGFRDLAQSMKVDLKENTENWSVHAVPHDYHGHFLGFEIQKPSGMIAGCRAGHLAPPPNLLPDDEEIS